MPRITKIHFCPQVRYVGNLTLIFRDKHTVIAKYGSTGLVFHRWFDRGLGDYGEKWKPFTRALKQQRLTDLSDLRRLVIKYDIACQSYGGGLSMPTELEEIKEKPTKE